jgi:hypothetical protein
VGGWGSLETWIRAQRAASAGATSLPASKPFLLVVVEVVAALFVLLPPSFSPEAASLPDGGSWAEATSLGRLC